MLIRRCLTSFHASTTIGQHPAISPITATGGTAGHGQVNPSATAIATATAYPTVRPTARPTVAPDYPWLEKGDEGSDVRRLQLALKGPYTMDGLNMVMGSPFSQYSQHAFSASIFMRL